MNPEIAIIAAKCLDGESVSRRDADFLASRTGADRHDVLYWAGAITRRFRGDRVRTCSILSARQGRCSEDCAFCAQSARYLSPIETYPLVPARRIIDAAKAALNGGAESFGIVTSGRAIGGNRKEFARLRSAVAELSQMPIRICASLGQLCAADIKALKKSGLRRLHHNLETSRRFFPRICTTHTYDERLQTVKAAAAAGLEVCCGGLFGLGEDWCDRLDLAFELKALNADSVPLNFLVPRPGTPLENATPLAPMEILTIIALFRFVLPGKEIKVCGGREANLRDMQSWIFHSGASGFMLGNYLTTPGRPPEDDLQMLKDLELTL